MSKETLATFLFDYLHKQGVHHAFGIPGDFALASFRHLERSPIEIITMTHEPAVGFAADSYTRLNGIGMAIVTYCVGGLNMVNSIAGAYAEKSPVVVISGGPSLLERQKDPLLHHKVRSFDTQYKIYREITCAQTILLDPDTAAQEIIDTIEQAKIHSQPVYIEVPYDMADQDITIPNVLAPKHNAIETDYDALHSCLEQLETRLKEASSPVIIAGVELQRFNYDDPVFNFAKKHQIPIASTLLSKSVVRETNPLYLGVYSGAISDENCRKAVEESDCLLLIGAFISDVLLGFNTASLKKQNTINFTSEKIKIGLQTFENIHLRDLLYELHHISLDTSFTPPPKPAPVPLADDSFSVTTMFNTLATMLDDSDTIICDTGDSLLGAMNLRTGLRSHFISNAYYLSMGFAVPAAIGASFATPQSRPIVLVGDGAFQMNGTELSTAAKYGLNPIVIVINNNGYGTQRHIIDGPFNDITMWHYSKAHDYIGYGQGAKVTSLDAFEKAFTQARISKETFLIEVVTTQSDCSAPLKRMGDALHKLRDISE